MFLVFDYLFCVLFSCIAHAALWQEVQGKRVKVSNIRAPSQVKFHTPVSTRGEANIFVLHFTQGSKYIYKDLRHILQKFFTEKDVS